MDKTLLHNRPRTLLTVLAIVFCWMAGPAYGTGLHDPWDMLLTQHVQEGRVDYWGFKANEQQLDDYLEALNRTDPERLDRNAQLAFYINSYNAYTIKLILMHFKDGQPVDSIKDIGSFFSTPWKIKFCRIGGKIYSLDNIEHDILRPHFREPRIHFALNCAARSCPPLISRAYRGETIEAQLEENTISFINDRQSTYIKSKRLYVSRIFKWFDEDFESGVKAFVLHYSRGELRQQIVAAGNTLALSYLEYDWSLNHR